MPSQPESLRIAWLVYRGNPYCGGQGVYVRHLSRELADHLIARKAARPLLEVEEAAYAASPVVSGGIVYMQDLESNVAAFNLETGELIWETKMEEVDQGPNGVTVEEGKVFGATGATNLTTGVGSAFLDRSPMIAFTDEMPAATGNATDWASNSSRSHLSASWMSTER